MQRTKLAAARYEKGWSQEEVAERIGVTRNTLGKWEQGRVVPYPIHIYRLCDLYGKSAFELDLAYTGKEAVKGDVSGETQNTLLKPTFTPTTTQKIVSSHLQTVSRDIIHALDEGEKCQYEPSTQQDKSDIPPPYQPSLPLTYPSSTHYNKSLSVPSGLDMLMISRRHVLKEILNTACAALTLSPYTLLPQNARERLESMTVRSSYVDEEALGVLATITQSYWTLSKNVSLDLLSGIAGHFTTIAQLLKESHPTPIYQKLSALASENALLMGKTFHDIREYDLAWEYYKFSLRIARDTQNTDLWATGVGRIALLFIYWGQPQQALPFLHEAQKNELHNLRLRPWLSAIEAEIHAMMGNVNDCLRQLEEAKSVSLPASLDDDCYVTGFNPSRAAGYEGACFARLRQPEQALPALEKAFSLCEPTSLRRRSTLLADRGLVYAQLGERQIACSLLLQALEMTAQTKSLVVLQRIYKGRGELDPWKESGDVKNLDERVLEMLTTLTKLKEYRQ